MRLQPLWVVLSHVGVRVVKGRPVAGDGLIVDGVYITSFTI